MTHRWTEHAPAASFDGPPPDRRPLPVHADDRRAAGCRAPFRESGVTRASQYAGRPMQVTCPTCLAATPPVPPPGVERERYADKVAEAALEAFWQHVAVAHPTATTGDLPPGIGHRLHAVAAAAVEAWIEGNVPGACPELAEAGE